MYWKGLGNALGEGLGQGVGNFIQTQNTLQQQEEQRQQRELDNSIRQRQLDEQVRQFDANLKFNRDNQVFQYLNDRRTQVAKLLSEGGYTPDEYRQAKEGLQATDKLLGKIVRGEELAADELTSYDQLLEGLGGLTAVGAGTLGADAAQSRGYQLTGQQQANTLTGQQIDYNADTYSDRIAQPGLQNKATRTATEGQQINNQVQRLNLDEMAQTSGSRVGRLIAENKAGEARAWMLADLVKLEGEAAKAEYLGRIADQGAIGMGIVQSMLDDGMIPESVAEAFKQRMQNRDTRDNAATRQAAATADITEADRDYAQAILQPKIDVFRSNADLEIKLNAAKEGLIPEMTAAQRAGYLGQIAELGVAGIPILNGLEAEKIISSAEAAGARIYAERASNRQRAELTSTQGAARTSTVQANVQEKTQGAQIRMANTQADRAAAELDFFRKSSPLQIQSLQTANAMATEQLGAYRDQRPYNLQALKTAVAQAELELKNARNLSPLQLATAQMNLRQLQSSVRVLEQTEGYQVGNARVGYELNAAQLNQVRQTAASTISRINAENKLGSATAAAQQGLLQFSVPAQQNAYLAEIASSGMMGLQTIREMRGRGAISAAMENRATQAARQAQMMRDDQVGTSRTNYMLLGMQAKEAISQANGNGVTDKKSMLQALDGMRKINAQNLSAARANYKMVAQRYLPNAQILADKWDPGAYTTAVGNANLTPEQKDSTLR